MTSTTTVVRMIGNKQGNPGPGSYNIPSDFGQAPKIAIKNKYKKKQQEPGVGYQNLASTIGTGRKWSISNKVNDRDYNNTPGPNYMPKKFGEEGRKSVFHEKIPDKGPGELSPGPAAYTIDSTIGKGKRFTIQSRAYPNNSGEIPGPGAGKFAPDYSKVMRSSTSSSIRPKYSEGKRAATPAPGDYRISRDLSRKSSCFHSKSREIVPEKTPGPGAYDVKRNFGNETPKYSMRNSRIDHKKELLDPEIVALPEVFGKTAPASAMHGKMADRDYNETPGPNYVPPAFGRDSAKYTLGTRREATRHLEREPPGPGTYDTRPKTAGPRYTIQSRAGLRDGSSMPPGPGVGKLNPDYTVVQRRSVMTAIRERPKERGGDKGPGYVDLGSTLSGPRFTIGRREELIITEGIE